MATKYWVGGDGVWSSLTNWRTTSGGAVITTPPDLLDAAVLDANSSTNVVTVDSNITIQTLTCTGFTGTLAFGTNTISLNSTGTIFTGATTMTVTGTPLIIATNSSATARTITPTAVTEANSISFRVAAGTGALTLTAGAYRDLDFTDGTNPTGYAGALGNSAITIYGSFKASTGMTRTAGTGSYTFAATSGTKTIATAGVTFDNPFIFNGVGGTWQLQDALTSGSSRTITLTNGTLDLNNLTLTVGFFSSGNTNIRSIAFGTGNITLTGNGATIWSTNNLTNFSYAGTFTVNCAYAGAIGTRTITTASGANGLTEANAPSFNITAGTDTVTIGNCKSINFTGFSGIFTNTAKTLYGSLTISNGMTCTAGANAVIFAGTSGVQQITTAGKTLDFPLSFSGIGGTFAFQDALTQGSTRAFTVTNGTVQLKAGVTSTVGALATSGTTQKFLQSTLAGTQATLSQATGTVNASYLTIKDNNAVGGATFNAYVTNNNINSGNNIGWDFYLPVNSIYDSLRLRGYTGTVTDMLLQYYKANGATSNSLQDAESEFLIIKGFTSGSNTDKWNAYLRSLSFTGTITDMLFNYWKDPA